MIIFGGLFSFAKGELNDLASYDLKNNQWTLIQPQGKPPAPRRGHTAVSNSENNMVVFGGFGNNVLFNDVAEYNWKSNEWLSVNPKGPSPLSRWRHIAVTTPRDTMLVFGGQGMIDGHNVFLNDLHEFDFETETWNEVKGKGDVPVPRSLMTVTLWDNQMFIYGGIKGFGGYKYYLSDVFQLDLGSWEWEEMQFPGAVPSARAQHASSLLSEVMVSVGGYDELLLNEVIGVNVKTSEWVRVFASGDRPFGLIEHSLISYEGSVYVFGGTDTSYDSVDGNNNNVWKISLTPDTGRVLQAL